MWRQLYPFQTVAFALISIHMLYFSFVAWKSNDNDTPLYKKVQNPNIAKKFLPWATKQKVHNRCTSPVLMLLESASYIYLHIHGNVSKQLFLDGTVIVLCFFSQDGQFSWLVAASLFFLLMGVFQCCQGTRMMDNFSQKRDNSRTLALTGAQV